MARSLYRPEAAALRRQNFANRETADPEKRCFQAGVPRAAYLRSPFQIFQNDRAVYVVYQDVHAYRVLYSDGSQHNDGLGYAMGDSRGHWEGNSLVADVTSASRNSCPTSSGVLSMWSETNRKPILCARSPLRSVQKISARPSG